MQKEYVIISGGGKGKRMGADKPKQFLELKGTPVIIHSIRAFFNYSRSIKFIIVLPEESVNDWEQIAEKYLQDIDFILCSGGETRFDSVKSGLEFIEGDGLVAIHDAVRPLVSVPLISKCFELASLKGNAIPVIPLTDSVREVIGDETQPLDREKLRLVQTPQVFNVSLIKKAYEQANRPVFSDDATVAESFGARINILEGERKNIKITTPDDLLTAAAFLK